MTSPEVSIEPVDLLAGQIGRKLRPHALLTQTTYGKRQMHAYMHTQVLGSIGGAIEEDLVTVAANVGTDL